MQACCWLAEGKQILLANNKPAWYKVEFYLGRIKFLHVERSYGTNGEDRGEWTGIIEKEYNLWRGSGGMDWDHRKGVEE